MQRPRFLPNNMTLLLMATLLLAILFPSYGDFAKLLSKISVFFIGVLFFLHGAKLSRETAIAGFIHWRLHATVLACTFIIFPVITFLLKPLIVALTSPDIYSGILFLSFLPSTVQSSIAFTSIAKGNVAAAICSASASNFLGVFLTPILVGVFMGTAHTNGDFSDSILKIMYQLFLPFVAGQIVQPWIGGWVQKHKMIVKFVDQGSVLLVVYVAFSAAMIEGLWNKFSPWTIVAIIVVCCILLACIMVISVLLSRKLGFNKADEVAIVFCGSKKSLASGVPIANVLFNSSSIGLIILPVMFFHQIQLIVCAMLAERYKKQYEEAHREDNQQMVR